jgi:sarcosine oxidase
VPSAVVVGAGVFGASLARELADGGWEVTLVDRCPPGHARAASGGDSRLIRCGHGDERWYTRSARRARTLWREIEAEARRELLFECGVVWLAHREGAWEEDTERALRDEGIPVERLGLDDLSSLFPSFDADGLVYGMLEPEGGVLRAREATAVVADQARARGARFVAGTAMPAGTEVDVDGRLLGADCVVWACGAWLAQLFPGLVPLKVTRQETFYLGAPIAWATPPLPAWVDYDEAVYGHGDLDGRGVKIACDHEGPPFDPESEPRAPTPEEERHVREPVGHRFPALREAPLVGAQVCQYALTPDTHFVFAPHPEHDGVWILGGGSGHGFKHGPALAEYVARCVEGREEPDERLGLGPRAPLAGFRASARSHI